MRASRLKRYRHRLLLRSALRGLLLLFVAVILLTLLAHYIRAYFMPYVDQVYANDLFFYGAFVASEIILSLIPPEFFMMGYILNNVSLSHFAGQVSVLAIISYGAGVLNYAVGRNFAHLQTVQKIETLFLARYRHQLRQYGKYFLLAGAITPIPFSAACMLMGIVQFPPRPFFLIAMARFLRFAIYGWVMWTIPAVLGSS